MKAPFPWFGGKSRAARIAWQAFGADVPNYVEPFAGSLAVLLARPGSPRIETVNDKDCYLANFWRAVQQAPDEVARHADWPVNEADLHARHLWLVNRSEFRERMKSAPDYFDARVAGWWVWGICQWIGGGWCAQPKPGCRVERKRPVLGGGGRGVGAPPQGRTNAGRQPRGIVARTVRKKPLIGGTKGTGVHKRGLAVNSQQRPHISDAGRGVLSLGRQLPCISGDSGASGRGIHASAGRDVYSWMAELSERLRRVRVCCGDWRRILGPSPTTCIGVTAVLLDPPYSAEAGRDGSLYAEEDLAVAHDVREWAVANGENPDLRIALCGYEGEHEMPADWTCVAWEAAGGYGSKANARRERIWFSPHCLTVRQQLALPLAGRGAA